MIGQVRAMAAAGRLGSVAAALLVTALAGLTGASAQDAKQASPVGGQWQSKTQADGNTVAGIALDEKQVDAVKRVNAYFNEFQNLKGGFIQTNAEKQRLRGKFYVKRPGKLRFEYNLPSKQLIVSDGQQLAIQDLDLGTDDRVALDQTPFRMLLKKDVDLLRDARINSVQEADDLVIVNLQDKSPDAPGRIQLFLTKAPQLELKEWVTTDAQGQDTRVELSGLVKGEDIDMAMFKIVNPGLGKPKSQ